MPIAPHHAKLPTYERELIGLVKAVKNWRPYLRGRPFTVRTDHYSLKFILDQRLTTIPQHTWVTKLFGYDMSVEYRPGKFNTVVDALPLRDEEQLTACALSTPTFELYDVLRTELAADAEAQAVRDKLAAHTAGDGWTAVDGPLLYKGKVFIPDTSSLWPALLAHTFMTPVTRVSRRRCTGGVRPSSTYTRASVCASSSADVLPVSATSQSTCTCIPPACCSHCRCHQQSGVIFPWISLKLFRRWAASQ